MRYYISLIAIAVIGLSIFTACQKSAPTIKTDTDRISLADAKADFDAGNAIFVDTRGEAAFRQEHIKGAISIPAETFEQKYKELPIDKKIIAYCS
jgi:predicted sulfurtransferase